MSGTTCYYCQVEHPRVEAGGVYYCPNRLCPGPGGHSHRAKLPSFAEDGEGKHTVDPNELLESVRANTNQDPVLWAAECRMVAWWKERA